MAYNRIQAKRICTGQEYELFESSFSDHAGQTTLVQLRARRQRVRNLRDKYRDLHKRQRLASRERTGSKKGDRADENQRTEQKLRLFAEALKRFDQRIATLESAEDRTAGKKAGGSAGRTLARQNPSGKKAYRKKASGKKAASRKAAGKKGPLKGKRGYVSEKAQGATQRGRDQKTRSKAVMGHTRAAGRRRQAKRDSSRRK